MRDSLKKSTDEIKKLQKDLDDSKDANEKIQEKLRNIQKQADNKMSKLAQTDIKQDYFAEMEAIQQEHADMMEQMQKKEEELEDLKRKIASGVIIEEKDEVSKKSKDKAGSVTHKSSKNQEGMEGSGSDFGESSAHSPSLKSLMKSKGGLTNDPSDLLKESKRLNQKQPKGQSGIKNLIRSAVARN